MRVGANSPSLCPTMFSVTYTGMNLFPLCTAMVWPTKSGEITDLLDQVLITDFFPESFISRTRFSSLKSIKGPFFSERLMLSYFFDFLFSTMYLSEYFFLARVLKPLAGIPFLDLGCPPEARPSPPPIG